MSAFQPKLLTVLREGYSRHQFTADLGAGLVVGIVALPLAIAFAIASGVTPERGLYTAIIAGFLISLLGGSRVQIGGPTGAFVVIVAGIVAEHGLAGLTLATIMAGLLLIGLGLARLGGVIKFIPYPIVLGFTVGHRGHHLLARSATSSASRMAEVPAEFFSKWQAYFEGGRHRQSSGVWCGRSPRLVLLAVWPRFITQSPRPVHRPGRLTPPWCHFARTCRSRPSVAASATLDFSLPRPIAPAVDEAMLVGLVGPAITIALLGAIESLLSAVVADGMIGGRHRSNTELIAQGVANMVTPIFGGIPATGAIARTATNIKNGGRTPVAGIVHAMTLLADHAVRWLRLRHASLSPRWPRSWWSSPGT